MESLAGKNALITGAGKGIGRAVAIALAKEGAHVALLARTEEQLNEVAEKAKSLGAKVAVLVADIADINSVNAAAEKSSGTIKASA